MRFRNTLRNNIAIGRLNNSVIVCACILINRYDLL